MFAHPEWLLLLPAPPMMALVAWLASRSRGKRWNALVADRLRATLILGDSALIRWFSLVSMLVAVLLLTIAMARPYAVTGSKAETIRSRNLIVAIDLSRSMRVRDVKPDRLAQAKIIAYELLDALPNERIGVIGFAGQSYLCAPLTVDHRAIRETINQLDESWVPLGGSNLTQAIDLAAETLRETGQKNNALIVLSDGEKHETSLDDAITHANRANMLVISIGIGTEDGGYVPHGDFPGNRMVDVNGKPVLSRLQTDALQTLAQETGGRFAIAGQGSDLTALVRDAVNDLDAHEIKGRQKPVKTEFYQWFVVPGVLFIFFSIITGTRWRKLAPHLALLLVWLCSAPSLHAAHPDEALKALHGGNLPQAAMQYEQLADACRSSRRKAGFRFGAATAYYRNRQYREARAAYSKALLSPDPATTGAAHLGIGNTLFQSGWRHLSSEPHPDGPEATTTMEDFDRLVRKFLRGGLANNDDESLSPYRRTRNLIRDWTDAIRHYECAIPMVASPITATANRDLTRRYLKRLEELLGEERDKMRQSIPPPQGGGEGTPDPDQDSGQSEEPGRQGSSGNHGNSSEPGSARPNGEENPKPNDSNEGTQNPQPGSKGLPDDTGPDSNPEERARRILRENSDNERGPLRPGQIEFRSPEKDW